MTTFTGKQAGKIIELFAETPSEQVQTLFASGLLTDLRDGNVEQVNREEFRRMLGLKPLTPPLFSFVDTVDVPAIDRFEVDRIKVGTVDGVKVGHVDPFFTTCFGGLVEEAQPALTLRRNELTRTASCSAINEALGKDVEEATCGQVLWMMANGKIRKDVKATILRVSDAKGILRLVFVHWYARCGVWHVYACELDSFHGWLAERRVFSRNSQGTKGLRTL